VCFSTKFNFDVKPKMRTLREIAISYIIKNYSIFKNKIPGILPDDLQQDINKKVAEDEVRKLQRERFF
jgi:hypothetical protein